MDNNYDFYYKFCLEKLGLFSQSRLCIEEMSELTKELCKYDRYKNTDKSIEIENNIKEELADVLNMVEQLAYHFGREEIEQIRKSKIDKMYNKYK